MGRPDWINDPRFAGNRARLINKNALVAEMAPILATWTRQRWIAMLQDAGVPATAIHSIEEAQAQPQVQALGMAVPVPGEDFSLTGLPLSFNGERPAFAHGAPQLGQDNAASGLADN
jgi:crotonobetainyl-CoA:carnitine CoA-transferase CaiB-like acyl-CoA transferase